MHYYIYIYKLKLRARHLTSDSARLVKLSLLAALIEWLTVLLEYINLINLP